MRTNPLVPAFFYYKFAEAISAPFTSLSAYSAGVIDSEGNIIKPESSLDPFEYFVIKLKKIFAQLPYGTTKASLASYIPALQMFSEEAKDYGMNFEHLNFFVEGLIACESNGELSYLDLVEDMGSANLGGPASSPSANTGGVSGVDLPMQKGIMKRKSVLGFENACEMYDVCPEEFATIQNSKAWRHIPDSPTKTVLQRKQRDLPTLQIAIRSIDPTTGKSNVHWIKFDNKEKKHLKEFYSSDAKDLTNVAVQNIIKPQEIDINPNTGELKRGAKTQRVGYLLSSLADMLKGGKKHQDTTAETLRPFAASEVSSGGIDTMAYDETKGLFVPADLKADNTTPFTHLSDKQKKLFPGLPKLSAKLAKITQSGTLSKTQKAELRKETEEIGEKSPTRLRSEFQKHILNLSPSLNWLITPGQSTKPYNYPGLVTRVSPEALTRYASGTAEPTLSPRPSQGRVEFKVRGREPTVKEVADTLSGKGSSSTSKEDILSALHQMISPSLQRQVHAIMRPYLARAK
tara:strand:- start:642 stop:2192 length:1551 start_codon:yes stop_codon:yes gene_type:complete